MTASTTPGAFQIVINNMSQTEQRNHLACSPPLLTYCLTWGAAIYLCGLISIGLEQLQWDDYNHEC